MPKLVLVKTGISENKMGTPSNISEEELAQLTNSVQIKIVPQGEQPYTQDDNPSMAAYRGREQVAIIIEKGEEFGQFTSPGIYETSVNLNDARKVLRDTSAE